jgi:hypothetical protein
MYIFALFALHSTATVQLFDGYWAAYFDLFCVAQNQNVTQYCKK